MNKKLILGVLALINSVAIYGLGLVEDVVQGAANVAGAAVETAGNVAEDIVEAPAAIVSGRPVYARNYEVGPSGQVYYSDEPVYRTPFEEKVVAE